MISCVKFHSCHDLHLQPKPWWPSKPSRIVATENHSDSPRSKRNSIEWTWLGQVMPWLLKSYEKHGYFVSTWWVIASRYWIRCSKAKRLLWCWFATYYAFQCKLSLKEDAAIISIPAGQSRWETFLYRRNQQRAPSQTLCLLRKILKCGCWVLKRVDSTEYCCYFQKCLSSGAVMCRLCLKPALERNKKWSEIWKLLYFGESHKQYTSPSSSLEYGGKSYDGLPWSVPQLGRIL